MRARWLVSTILVILPAGAPSAQQSHLDTHYQIEQMATTFADHYNKQKLLLSRACLPKMLSKSHRTEQPLALDRRRSRIPSKRNSNPGFHILSKWLIKFRTRSGCRCHD